MVTRVNPVTGSYYDEDSDLLDDRVFLRFARLMIAHRLIGDPYSDTDEMLAPDHPERVARLSQRVAHAILDVEREQEAADDQA